MAGRDGRRRCAADRNGSLCPWKGGDDRGAAASGHVSKHLLEFNICSMTGHSTPAALPTNRSSTSSSCSVVPPVTIQRISRCILYLLGYQFILFILSFAIVIIQLLNIFWAKTLSKAEVTSLMAASSSALAAPPPSNASAPSKASVPISYPAPLDTSKIAHGGGRDKREEESPHAIFQGAVLPMAQPSPTQPNIREHQIHSQAENGQQQVLISTPAGGQASRHPRHHSSGLQEIPGLSASEVPGLNGDLTASGASSAGVHSTLSGSTSKSGDSPSSPPLGVMAAATVDIAVSTAGGKVENNYEVLEIDGDSVCKDPGGSDGLDDAARQWKKEDREDGDEGGEGEGEGEKGARWDEGKTDEVEELNGRKGEGDKAGQCEGQKTEGLTAGLLTSGKLPSNPMSLVSAVHDLPPRVVVLLHDASI